MNFFGYFVHDFSPFLIRFTDQVGIRYYGLAYVLGFLIFYWMLRYQIRRGWCRLPLERVEECVTWVALGGVIIGGRVGYCLFYDWHRTVEDPLSIFQIWHGGMASHGGILGVIGVMIWYARRAKISFYNLADAAALATPLGLGLGRLANFMNGELWGRPTNVVWACIFPEAPLIYGAAVPRHPSQLYEAFLEGFLLFGILWWIRHRTSKEGVTALSFMTGYAVLRFIGEAYREPDLQIGYYRWGWTQGQLFSIALLVLTLVLWWRLVARLKLKTGGTSSCSSVESK